MWRVFAFYPNLGIKIRGTEYKSRVEAMDYVSGLIECRTPYFVLNGEKMSEYKSFDMKPEEMAEMVEEYL